MSPSATLVALNHAVSGAAGTAASTAAVFPIDLATTRLKAQRATHGAKQHDGLWNSLRSIVENEGGKSTLYTGLGPSVAKSAMDSFLFFGFYSYLRSRSHHPDVVRELATGAIAGACARFLTTPISTVVTRLQLSAQSKTLLHTLVEVYGGAGISGLWSGYSATLFLTMNPSIILFVNRQLANRILPALEDEDIPVAWVAFLLATLSKSTAILLTYPLQVGRLRLQMTSDSRNNASLTDEKP